MRMRWLCALVLSCAVLFSVNTGIAASAAVQPEGDASIQASYYLDSYTAWTSIGSDSKVYVYYSANATDTVARLGAKLVVVQVKDAGVWKNVLVKSGTVANGMLAQNRTSHGGTVVYQGTAGKTYRAVVTIYGGPASGGDSRIITTNSVP